jgi:anti-sigma regulatory factor (Ser/Thr protein kinase)
MGEGSVVTWADPVTDPPGMAASWPLSTSLPLGALPGATPCARLHARAVLSEWGLGELAEAAELVVSELVTNAVRASTTPDGHPRYDGAGMPVVVLRMASDHIKLMIEVWDVIPGAPAAARPGPDDESGRGLMLVAAQCDRWSWQTVPGWPGKVVWAELHGSLLGAEFHMQGADVHHASLPSHRYSPCTESPPCGRFIRRGCRVHAAQTTWKWHPRR